MNQEKMKIGKIILAAILLVAVVFTVRYFYYHQSRIGERKAGNLNQNDNRGKNNQSCKEIDVSLWQKYDAGFYSLKYPTDWQAGTVAYSPPPPGKENMSPPPWTASFGPKAQNPLVWFGLFRGSKEDFKKEIEGSSDELSSKYKVLKEEKVKIGDKEGVKLTISADRLPYSLLAYYFSSQVLIGGSVAVFRGPEESEYFNSCEPEIFQKIVESFQVKKTQ
jgi:hypothetical protein